LPIIKVFWYFVEFVFSIHITSLPYWRSLGKCVQISKTFDEIYILNLHGNSNIGESPPNGGVDKNVFDIKQGVAIVFLVKLQNGKKDTKVCYADLWGSQESKYRILNEQDITTIDWSEIEASSPYYFFVPKDFSLIDEYEVGMSLSEIFPVKSTGIETGRDNHLVSFKPEKVEEVARVITDSSVTDEKLETLYSIRDTSGWPVSRRRESVLQEGFSSSQIAPIHYRPFDRRYVYFSSFLRRAHESTMTHMLKPNLGITTTRQVTTLPFNHILAARYVTEYKRVSTDRNCYLFPLYLYPNGSIGRLFDETATSPWEPNPDQGGRVPNLSQSFTEAFKKKIGLNFDAQKINTVCGESCGPRDLLAYTYAILYSPTYRERYAEFLKIDFPRVPITSDVDLFWNLVSLGNELIQLHLMEHPKLARTITSYPVNGSNRVKHRGGFPKFIPEGKSRTKTGEIADKNRVYINLEQHFDGVPEEVWEFEVGGYQVLYKWLKDRRGRVLNYDDLNHYQRIVVALQETIRLMKEIDAAIPSWPIE
jgi:predicted helicase